nr:no significant similarity found [uncultured bacterium]
MSKKLLFARKTDCLSHQKRHQKQMLCLEKPSRAQSMARRK